jgi:hypothetical protein
VLFTVTAGIGYLTWSLFAWAKGQTPAQRILSLRCWLPEPRSVAGREQTAQRQITCFFLNGQLRAGLFIWLSSSQSSWRFPDTLAAIIDHAIIDRQAVSCPAPRPGCSAGAASSAAPSTSCWP